MNLLIVCFQGLDDYNVMYTDFCSSYSQNTLAQQNQDELYFSNIEAVHESRGKDDIEDQLFAENIYSRNCVVVGEWNVLAKCIDQTTMDDYLQSACCGLEGERIRKRTLSDNQ